MIMLPSVGELGIYYRGTGTECNKVQSGIGIGTQDVDKTISRMS
jgi:hypothetical protein